MSPWAISIASAGMACEARHDRGDRPGTRTPNSVDDTRLSRSSARDRSGRRYRLHRLAHIAALGDPVAQPTLANLRPWYLGGLKREPFRCLPSQGSLG